ncbi:MAG: NAD(P)-dependent oxidoreductase [Phycisphaerae bacterium]|nr:NAD(P)-dependent oxidoreductase [Gemmatimonadaceae bacterium]
MTTPIALLGTGLLGSAFAEGLLARAGSTLTVWNRTRAKAEPLAALGAHVAETAADAVRDAERVHLVLLDDDTVDETIQAFREALRPGAVIVDHTTLRPDRTAARAAALDAAGIEYLHCPVMMGPPAARAAKGNMFIAGPTERYERVKVALAEMTGEAHFLGERADLAACYKLCANAMLLMMAGSLADVFHMADAMKMPREAVGDVFRKFNTDGILNARGTRMMNGDYKATFTLDVARKDVRLMVESAGHEPVPMLRALGQRMDDALAAGLQEFDIGVLSKPGF